MYREQIDSILDQIYTIEEFETSHWDFLLDEIELWPLLKSFPISPKIYFRNKEDNREYLGLGVCQTFTNQDDLKTVNELMNKDSDLIFLGGLKFDRNTPISPEWSAFGEMSVILPRVLFINKSEGQQTIVRFYKGENESLGSFQNSILATLTGNTFKEENNSYKFVGQTLNPDFSNWSSNMARALQLIEEDKISKIVLSRKIVQEANQELNAPSICYDYGNTKNNHFVYYHELAPDQAFFSISPERLLKITEGRLTIDAIAGTRPVIASDPFKTQRYTDQLLVSSKESAEHQAVVDDITLKINQLGLTAYIGKRDILTLKYVQHLFTPIEAKYQEESVDIPSLLKTFHPTPAVGGNPRAEALSYIHELEGYDRGFYAGPVGVFSQEYTDLLVAIRSLLISKKEAHIIVGVGVVKGSAPEDEWKETEAKFRNFKSLYQTI
jgi:menaquinone-specific isochorismate synthase